MTEVIVTCQFCALRFRLPAPDVAVWTWDRHPHLNHYTFTCRDCGQESKRPASEGVLDDLANAPVTRIHTIVPDETDDPARFTGCRDDLLDALNELQGDITCPTQ